MGTVQLINLLGKWLTPRTRMGVKALGHRLLIKFLYNLLGKAIEFVVVFFEFFTKTNKFLIEGRLVTEKKNSPRYQSIYALLPLWTYNIVFLCIPREQQILNLSKPWRAPLQSRNLRPPCCLTSHLLHCVHKHSTSSTRSKRNWSSWLISWSHGTLLPPWSFRKWRCFISVFEAYFPGY